MNFDLAEKFSKESKVDIPVDGVKRLFVIPAIAGLSTTYFVDLRLTDAAGEVVSSNFYWLSTHPDELDWEHSNWYLTPTKSYADLTELNSLPKVRLQFSSSSEQNGGDDLTHVTVTNPTRTLAFAVHLRVMTPTRKFEGDGPETDEEILPVRWEDNYFPLLPGERREVTARYREQGKHRRPVKVAVDGWNVTAAMHGSEAEQLKRN